MNFFEMARRVLVNDMVERTPPHERLRVQLEVLHEHAVELVELTAKLRERAEALAREFGLDKNEGGDKP
jgi:hypothetical protein